MDGCMNKCMDGRMNGWMNAWMDGWMEDRINNYEGGRSNHQQMQRVTR